ncbi:hypothetical protein Esti_003752 [Eimeria stiedai]
MLTHAPDPIMECTDPLSKLRSLVAKVLGGTEAKPNADTAATPSDQNSNYEGEKLQNWLSHFAAVAPDHIKRWTNPEDGSGSIPYEQLVENLQKYNIPARHISQYTIGQLLGVEPLPPEIPAADTQPSCASADVPTHAPRPHKLDAPAAAYLGRKQDPTFTQVVPVRAVTKAFVGPVREKVGHISGQSCKLLKRPGEHSEVPPDYVEVVGSKRVTPIGCEVYVPSRQSSQVSAITSAVGPLRLSSESQCHAPPPIYLEPVLDSKPGQSAGSQGLYSAAGSRAAAEFVASIPKRTRGKVDLRSVQTKEDEEIYKASNKPVVYTMGTYVWSKEQAERGDAQPVDIPPVDACFSKLCEEVFAPRPSGSTLPASTSSTTGEQETRKPTLGLPEILEKCKKSREQLAAFADKVVEMKEASSVGGRGLFCTKDVKKGELIFVEMPLLTCDTEMESMWSTFTSLTDEQQAAMETLEGCPTDLSKEESLWCILTARANKRIDLAKPFKLFLARLKRNAHGLPTQARWAVYPKAAMVNHSCEPNVTYRNLNGLLVYFAVRDIAQGDMITMTYIDQLYASASFRSQRLLHTKCFTCRCSRCRSPEEKVRRMLCPSCRPIKLKIVDPAAEVLTNPPSAEAAKQERGRPVVDDQQEAKTSEKDEAAAEEAGPTAGAETSAHASDKESRGALHSNEGEGQLAEDSSNQASDMEDGSCVMSDKEIASSDSGEALGSDLGEGIFASDADTQGCSDCDSASNSGRPDLLSDGETPKFNKSASNLKNKLGSGPLMLSMWPMEASASKSTEWAPGSSDEERSECCVSDVDAGCENVKEPAEKPPKMYCQREADQSWVCYTCMGRFTDDEMPLGMEAYFEQLYIQLQNRFNLPNTPQWTVDVGSLIKSIEAVLGTQHWLYAACNLLLAQLYLGQWAGGMIRDAIFDRALKHAELFINFVESTTREALHVDSAPLVASLMRVLLFNGRWSVFEEWVAKGRLALVQDCMGSWDETFVSFSQAHEYLLSCRARGELPQLSVLHRYAHTSQQSIVEAAERLVEAEEAAKKAKEEAARERQRKSQAEQQRLRALEERNRRLRERIAQLRADAAFREKVKDVTASHPQGVLAQFMLAGVDRRVVNDASKAAQQAYQYAKQMQEAAVQGRQLCPGHLAADKAYLPPDGIMPSSYLPLIMLDDPLRAIPEKSRQARQRRAQAAREQALLEKRLAEEDLDFEEDESVVDACNEESTEENNKGDCDRTMVYRIPGLPGVAPGEFVNVSQLVHDETGKHEPLPLFKSFFYIDTAERRRNHAKAEEQSSLVVLGSSSTPPPLPQEKLEDLEAAKYNYLRAERQQFEKDVKAGVLLVAAEAGALQDETKLIDVVEATNKVIRDMTVQEAKAERSLEAARYALKNMEFPQPPSSSTVAEVSSGASPNDEPTEEKPQAQTTGCIDSSMKSGGPTLPSPHHSVTLPTVWESAPSENSEDGPTVFLYPPGQSAAAAHKEGSSSTDCQSEDSDGSPTEMYMRKRIIKQLDFSKIPPLPNPEVFAAAIGNTHQHYKLSRMNMMLARYASPKKATDRS